MRVAGKKNVDLIDLFCSKLRADLPTLSSIPVTLTFEQATGKNVLLLPMGSSTDAAHSINEKLDKRNYIEGTKLLGAYLHYVAEEKA